MISLKQLLDGLTDYQGPIPDLMITAADIDSRKVIPGSLFIALPGERTDGHDFIADAFGKGASLALVQKDVSGQYPVLNLSDGSVKPSSTIPIPPFCIQVQDSLKALQQISKYWRRQLDLRVIGITGSVGKSSTKELVAEVLGQKFHTFKNPGNYNNEIGLPLTLLNMGTGHQYAVLEMGFYYPGEITFLCEIAQPQIGIVTNIGTVHAERAGSQAEIVKGKTELVQALPASPEGIALLNQDDPLVRPMAQMTKARVVTYGSNSDADVWASDIISKGLAGIEFSVHSTDGTHHVASPLLGRHSVMTCLRAITVGIIEGLSFEEISKGLAGAQSQLRMTVYRHPSGAIVLDDTYNATPESTLAALDFLADIPGYHVAVLGDMLELGEYEQTGHERVGSHAAKTVDLLIAIGSCSKNMIDSAKKAGLAAQSVFWFEDVMQSLDLVKKYCSKNTVILVKGSHGMKMDRITAVLKELG
jgi:UDP-N-acetylmuramoyl-tripeptide--D-alanyl-D-alanine ligase